MNPICLAILALVAGPDGCSAPRRVDLRPSIVGGPRSVERSPGRSIAPARRAHRSPFSSRWTLSGMDDLDSEPVDETWFLQLDAYRLSVGRWPAWGLPGSAQALEPTARPDRPSRIGFPLRC